MWRGLRRGTDSRDADDSLRARQNLRKLILEELMGQILGVERERRAAVRDEECRHATRVSECGHVGVSCAGGVTVDQQCKKEEQAEAQLACEEAMRQRGRLGKTKCR